MMGAAEKTFLPPSSPKLPFSPSPSSSSSTKVSTESGDVLSSRNAFSYMPIISSYVHCIFVLLALAGIALTVIDYKSQTRLVMESRGEVPPFHGIGSYLFYRDKDKDDNSGGWGIEDKSDRENEISRKLSMKIDPISGDSVVTYNGDVPETQCPIGKYRLPGSTDLQMIRGQRTDGCIYCPRGKYGETTTLSSKECTASCPRGRFGDTLGAKSINECKYCPPGKYGSSGGLTTSQCSGKCPADKYSGKFGATDSNVCVKCPPGYRGWQCGSWDNIPLKDSQLNRLNSGQVVPDPDRILE